MANNETALTNKLCDLWQQKALTMVKRFPPLDVAETMFSCAVDGWIKLVGERRVAHHLYLLSLQLFETAEQKDKAAQQAGASTKH